MRFEVTGQIWDLSGITRPFSQEFLVDTSDSSKPLEELKSVLFKFCLKENLLRARWIMKCSVLGLEQNFKYGPGWEVDGIHFERFKQIIEKTSQPTKAFEYLISEIPWLANIDIAATYHFYAKHLTTDEVMKIWHWRRAKSSETENEMLNSSLSRK
ncbi:MAG: hypothetical protein EOO96_06620 [Pedobacter sp.]|nr:MAG: hypothetical protein EOO96_06620 [Pedobacter sp.]